MYPSSEQLLCSSPFLSSSLLVESALSLVTASAIVPACLSRCAWRGFLVVRRSSCLREAGRHDSCKVACFVSCSILPRASSLFTLRPSLVGVPLVFGCVLVAVKSQSLVRFWIASASGVLLFAHCTITIIDTQSSYRQKIFTRLAHGQSI